MPYRQRLSPWKNCICVQSADDFGNQLDKFSTRRLRHRRRFIFEQRTIFRADETFLRYEK